MKSEIVFDEDPIQTRAVSYRRKDSIASSKSSKSTGSNRRLRNKFGERERIPMF